MSLMLIKLRQRASAFKRMRQRDLVGVLQVDSHRDTASQSRNSQRQASFLDVSLQKQRSGFSLDLCVGGNDDLGDTIVLDALNQLGNVQLFWPDTVNW